MMISVVAAVVGGLTCSDAQAPSQCQLITEVRARSRRAYVVRRPSCAGLEKIERIYSVGVEHGVVCIPVRSLVAGS